MNALVAAARAYLGCPFQHMGRSRLGMDCAGLVLLALRDIGHDPIDVPSYGRQPWKDGLRAAVEAFYGPPADDAPQVGDVLLMRFAREPQHLAIVGDYLTGGLSIIHSRADTRKVVETRLGDADLACIVAVYRGVA